MAPKVQNNIRKLLKTKEKQNKTNKNSKQQKTAYKEQIQLNLDKLKKREITKE